MPFVRKRQTALTVFHIIIVAVTLIFILRAAGLQLFNADTYKLQAAGISKRTSVLKAPRGEILDCFGREIAVNRDGYNIVFNAAYIDKQTLNDDILTLINYLDSQNTQYIDYLPIEKGGNYGFTDDLEDGFQKEIGLAHYATAQHCFEELIKKYSLQSYTKLDARKIMGVRYSMQHMDFSVSNIYTFAEDVPIEIMQRVCEAGFLLKGVSVNVVPFREYVESSLAPNIIGQVGPVTAENWAEYKDKGYSYSDKVGVSGIESYCEDLLHGTDGIITYTIDKNGTILDSEITKTPIPGKTVKLTLDKTVQLSTQSELASVINEIRTKNSACTGGAAVVMKVNTGEVLCAANFPSYDADTLKENYTSLLNDPSLPLLNRSFSGIYPIGSTAKPAVAIAAIMRNKLTADETIRCVHTYNYFADYRPSCMGTHGSINLETALSKSCNYFFFEVGRRIGATVITDTFKQFGLGADTGIELSASQGLVADVKDGDGDTLQIAIGQKDAFTPLQLAVYCSTLANGGNRYRATLINSVASYDLKETFYENEHEVLNKVEMSDYAISSVKKGMLSVTQDGTGSRIFSSYPIKVGGKTGTSQVSDGVDHSVFIAFAPFDNPEIAIAVVLEHGNNGGAAGTIVKEALDSYFFSKIPTADNTEYNTALR